MNSAKTFSRQHLFGEYLPFVGDPMTTAESFANGDAMLGLANLVQEHAALLYRVAFRLTGSAAEAEDLVQQTFLIAHKHISSLRQDSSAKSWLCKILRNLFLKSLRHPAPLLIGDVPDNSSEWPAENPIDSEQLQLALMELPEEYRLPLVMFYFQDNSYQEIAEQLKVPLGTVMSRLSRAKAQLRKRLTPTAVES